MQRFFGMSPPESPAQHLSDRDIHPFLSSSLPFESLEPVNYMQPQSIYDRRVMENQTSQTSDASLFGQSLDPVRPLSASQQHLSTQLSNMAIDDIEFQSPMRESHSQLSLTKSQEDMAIFSMDDDVVESTGVNPMEIYHPPPNLLNKSLSSSLEGLPIIGSVTSQRYVPEINVVPAQLTHELLRKSRSKLFQRSKTNEVKQLFTSDQLQTFSHNALGILTTGLSTGSSDLSSTPIPIPQSGNMPMLSEGANASFALSPPSPSTPISPLFIGSSSPVAFITSQAKLGPDGMYGCICGKRYATLGALKNHAKLHGPRERNYVCNICNNAFLRKQDLKRHETTHLEDYHPFTCENCGTKFTRSDALSRHLKARRCMKD